MRVVAYNVPAITPRCHHDEFTLTPCQYWGIKSWDVWLPNTSKRESSIYWYVSFGIHAELYIRWLLSDSLAALCISPELDHRSKTLHTRLRWINWNRFWRRVSICKECSRWECIFWSFANEIIINHLIHDLLSPDSASIAFSELLEELALTDEGIPLLNEIRKIYAPSVEDLRADLKKLYSKWKLCDTSVVFLYTEVGRRESVG